MIKTIKWWLIYSVRNFLVLVGFWLVIQPVLNDDDDDDDDGEITKKWSANNYFTLYLIW